MIELNNHDWSYINALVFLSCLLFAISIFNIIIDPYNISKVVRISRFNAAKVRQWQNARLTKPFDFSRHKYDGIILGTSQIERGIDPDHKNISKFGKLSYNFGLSESTLYESARVFNFAATTSSIKWAIFSLDFARYIQPTILSIRDVPNKYNKSSLICEYLKTLISVKGTSDSLFTIKSNLKGEVALQHSLTGLLDIDGFNAKVGRPHPGGVFDNVDSAYINHAYTRMITEVKLLSQFGFNHNVFLSTIEIAIKHKIQLYFLIPPIHARGMIIIEQLGLMPLFEQWKRELIHVIEAKVNNIEKSYPLWDFTGYTEITTETIPNNDDEPTNLKWFYDSIHFTPVVGQMMLDRIFDSMSSEAFLPEDFGIRLSSDNLSSHLNKIHAGQKKYINKNPEVFEILNRLYSDLR
jgi:hypothetical protein